MQTDNADLKKENTDMKEKVKNLEALVANMERGVAISSRIVPGDEWHGHFPEFTEMNLKMPLTFRSDIFALALLLLKYETLEQRIVSTCTMSN